MVTLNFREQAPSPPVTAALVICEAAISFFRGGQAQESASKRIVEFDVPGAVDQARKFIGENELFFRNVNKKLSQ
jgi:hypothetical protein